MARITIIAHPDDTHTSEGGATWCRTNVDECASTITNEEELTDESVEPEYGCCEECEEPFHAGDRHWLCLDGGAYVCDDCVSVQEAS